MLLQQQELQLPASTLFKLAALRVPPVSLVEPRGATATRGSKQEATSWKQQQVTAGFLLSGRAGLFLCVLFVAIHDTGADVV